MIDIYRKRDNEQLCEHKTNRSVVQLDKNGVLKIVKEEEAIRILNEEVDRLQATLESKRASTSPAHPLTIFIICSLYRN